jgi:cytoskeletal protein CcmA (bactofilin family)
MRYSDGLFGRKEAPRVPGSPASSPAPGHAAAAPPLAAVPRAAPSAPAANAETVHRSEEVTGSRLIVGPNIKLRGVEIDDCDTLVVEGRVEATMVSRAIQIAEQGAFKGTADIEVAEIRGSFEGELTVRGRLVVHATGRVSGKVRYGKLLVQEGGEITGDVGTLGERTAGVRSA